MGNGAEPISEFLLAPPPRNCWYKLCSKWSAAADDEDEDEEGCRTEAAHLQECPPPPPKKRCYMI